MSPRRPRRFTRAFTLVELLVVIGIIALLISVLLPSLNAARKSANGIKCAANLRSVSQLMAIYTVDYKGAYPPAFYYAGENISNGVQTPDKQTGGVVHWSYLLFPKNGVPNDLTQNPVPDPNKWVLSKEMFTCPEFDRGGLAPQSPTLDNLDPGQTVEGPGTVDFQAPRMAYTANAAIIPNNKWTVGFQSTLNPFRIVKLGSVKRPTSTILLTEFTNVLGVVQDKSRFTGQPASKSNRPINGFVIDGKTNPNIETFAPGTPFHPTRASELSKVKPVDYATGSVNSQTRLDWVGRNHGTDKNWFKRKTNFLYVDGHVETKLLEQTLSPFEWGDRFYSLKSSDGLYIPPN